jgi:hypothetical protein
MSDQNQPPSDQSDPWAQFPAVTWNDFPETPRTPAQQHAARVEGFRPEAEALLQRQERIRAGVPAHPDVEIPLITPLARRLSAGVQAGVGEIGERLNLTERQDFGDRYSNALAREEAARNAYRAANPNLARAGDVGGVVAGVAGIPQTGAANLIMRGASRLPAFLEPITRRVAPLVGAAAEGAIQGAPAAMVEALPGESLADVGQRGLAGATEGAAFGAGAQAVLPTAGRLTLGAVQTARNILNPAGRAERRVAEAVQAGRPTSQTLTQQEYDDLVAQGLNPSLVDVQGGQKVIRQALGRVEGSQEAQDFQQMLRNRNQQLNQSTQNRIDATMTGSPNQTIDAADILRVSRETAQKQNAPAYARAFSNPAAQNILTPELQGVTSLPIGQNAVNDAVNGLGTRYALQGNRFDSPFALRDPAQAFSLNNPYVLDPSKPVNLEFWDRFRRSLDDQYQELLRAGNRTAAGDVLQVRNHLQDLLTTRVTDYATAVNGAGRYIRGDNAFSAGTEFLDMLGANAQNRDIQSLGRQLNQFRTNFSNDERQQFALGVASRFRSRPDEAAALFGSGDSLVMRNLREVLGSQFEPIRSTMLLHNVARQVESLVPIRPAIPGAGATTAANVLGNVGYSFLTGNVSPKLIGATILGQVALEVRNHRLRNEAFEILRMASNPNQIGSLTNLINTNARYRQALEALQPALNSAVARQAAASNEEPERATRASGGRITGHHRAKAQALINAADRAKKAHNGTTKPILDMPDETVAKALSLADQAI